MAKFQKGDIVRISPYGHARSIRKNKPYSTGIVAGRPMTDHLTSVIWEGTKTPGTYHNDFLELVVSRENLGPSTFAAGLGETGHSPAEDLQPGSQQSAVAACDTTEQTCVVDISRCPGLKAALGVS